MAEWITLGTANAVPDEAHANTHFVLVDGDRILLVDAPCEVASRLRRAGVSPWEITDLLLTHFHPDHTAGVPMLLMDAWLQGRRAPLHVYGLDDVITRLQQVMALYRWENWPEFFPVVFHTVPAARRAEVMTTPGWQVLASPGVHHVPAIGIRIDFADGEVLAYSGDTAPADAIVELATGADYLFHEATGAMEGHTSAAQAGEIAARAGVKRLYLVHTSTDVAERSRLEAEAAKAFAGPVVVAEDLFRLVVGE